MGLAPSVISLWPCQLDAESGAFSVGSDAIVAGREGLVASNFPILARPTRLGGFHCWSHRDERVLETFNSQLQAES